MNTRHYHLARALQRDHRLTEAEHLAKLSGKQHALVEHLKEPSVLHEIVQAIEAGPVPSKSALFMLHLIDGAWDRLEADKS